MASVDSKNLIQIVEKHYTTGLYGVCYRRNDYERPRSLYKGPQSELISLSRL